MSARRVIHVRAGRLAVCRFSPDEPPPAWVLHREARFWSITRTPGELSVVCAEDDLPPSVTAREGGWRALELHGPIPFEITGLLASIVTPLAEARVPVFALSTFDTDWVLVKERDLERAAVALSGSFEIVESVGS